MQDKIKKQSGLANCLLCPVNIDQKNNTEEHIIPQAIGGRKIVKFFICDNCNNKTGILWENEIFNQLKEFCVLFDIKRHRKKLGAIPVNLTDGTQLQLYPSGNFTPRKASVEEILGDEKRTIKVIAKNPEEAEKIISGFLAKYGEEFQVEGNPELEYTYEYTDQEIHFSKNFGGDLASRSMIKTCLALISKHGINPHLCNVAVQCLKSKEPSNNWNLCYQKDLIINRLQGFPFHCVYVIGIQHENIVVGYVEYFGFYRFISLLSDSYTGNDFSIIYALDPTTGKEISNIEIDKRLISRENLNTFLNRALPDILLMNALNDIVHAAQKAAYDKEITSVSNRLHDDLIKKFPKGLSKDDYQEFIKTLDEKLMPFIKSHSK